MRSFRVLLPILILFIISYISCDKKVTDQPDMGTLIGKVYQQSRGLTYYIPDAKVNVDGYVTYSDSTGRFEIEVPKGEHTITGSKYPFDTTFISKVTVNDYRAYNLLMTGPTYSISGTVTDTLGNKIEGAVAILEHLRDTSDADGYIFFDSIPTGYWEFLATKNEFSYMEDSLKIDTSNIDLNIQLTRLSFDVSGTVSHTLDGLLTGIEVVLDDTLYDTTDINGEFLFEQVYSGEHHLGFYSDTYDYESKDFNIELENYNTSISLKKLYIDTLWIEKDANVSYWYEDGSKSNININEKLNSGDAEEYNIFYDYFYVFGHTGWYVRSWIDRVFVQFPIINSINVDSVILLYTARSFVTPENIQFSTLDSAWDEHTILWDNQPSAKNDFLNIQPVIGNDLKWRVNITDYIDYFCDSLGIRIKFGAESCGFMCSSSLPLYSSEHPDISNRPHILVYRSE